MIKLHKSFILVAAAMIAAGYGGLLLVLAVSLTLHELAHILAVKHFGGKVNGVRLTALGEIAVVHGLETFAPWQRYIVYIAGPGVNFFLAGLTYIFGWPDWVLYNLILGLFNLLPVFPLDGGRIMQMFLGNRIGVLRANRVMVRLGRAVGLLLLVPGCVQVLLFPYNISLICAGMYIKRKNDKILLTLTMEFFRFMSKKKTGLLPVKFLHVWDGASLQRMVERLGWDSVTYFRINGGDVHEQVVMDHVYTHGLTGMMGDIKVNCCANCAAASTPSSRRFPYGRPVYKNFARRRLRSVPKWSSRA
jgi:stage IV sporulation protein FB